LVTTEAADSLVVDRRLLDLRDAVVFTDDKSGLDLYNLQASNSWRLAYNKYYTGFFLENGIPLFKQVTR